MPVGATGEVAELVSEHVCVWLQSPRLSAGWLGSPNPAPGHSISYLPGIQGPPAQTSCLVIEGKLGQERVPANDHSGIPA